MFPFFWPSEEAKKQHSSPSNATNPPHGNRVPLMRDIEAAVSVGSSTTQPSLASDPLHRRSSVAATMHNHGSSNIETTEAPAASTLLPQHTSYADSLSKSVRSGNVSTADLLEAKATTDKSLRGPSKVLMVAPEPVLLHSYVRKFIYCFWYTMKCID